VGAYSVHTDPLAAFKGLASKGKRKGRGRKGPKRELGKGRGRKGVSGGVSGGGGVDIAWPDF